MFQPLWEFVRAQIEHINTAQVKYCSIHMHVSSLSKKVLEDLQN